MQTFVIGDIHGGLRALKQVLDKAPIENKDTLVFLGDYVDGWSESAQVIDFLMELENNYTCIFIKGNHDAWCEQWLYDETRNNAWFQQGGEASIKSYENYTQEDKKKHLDFFNKMKFYHTDLANNLFIHAGFTSMHGPEKEVYETNFNWDRTLWEMALAMDKKLEKNSVLYPKRLKLYNEIFIGHTPTTNYNMDTPMHAINVWNIDTGAAFTGKLSILNIKTKEFWQSDALLKLYPNEKGRNK